MKAATSYLNSWILSVTKKIASLLKPINWNMWEKQLKVSTFVTKRLINCHLLKWQKYLKTSKIWKGLSQDSGFESKMVCIKMIWVWFTLTKVMRSITSRWYQDMIHKVWKKDIKGPKIWIHSNDSPKCLLMIDTGNRWIQS